MTQTEVPPQPATGPDSHDHPPASLEQSVAHQIVAILYRQVPLLCALVMVSSLVLATAGLQGQPAYWGWLATQMVVCVARLIDYTAWRRRSEHEQPMARHSLRRLTAGVCATGLIWSVFPALFFESLTWMQQAIVLMTYGVFVGGSVAILVITRWLQVVNATLLLGPMSVYFIASGNRFDLTAGLIGFGLLAALVPITRGLQRAPLQAIRLGLINRRLMEQAVAARERTEGLNHKLEAARQALTLSNRNLENRVRRRTLALEREIREHSELASRMMRMASSDTLTGLANRAQLEQSLDAMLRVAAESDQHLAVLFVDLDRFKEVNDAIGHQAGDHVLRAVSRRLGDRIGKGGVLSRWGGDEFVAALPDIRNADEAMAIAAALRQLTAEPIPIQNDIVRIDACVGVALYPDDGRDADALVRAADLAVYAAKISGRSSVRRFVDSMHAVVRERHNLVQALRQAIEQQSLQLHFQPILSVSDRRTVAFEALTRWPHPTRGWVSPQEFIPIAEQSGSIIALGRWALRAGCAAAASWPGPDAPSVAINVSTAQIMSAGFIDDVRRALHDSALSADRLELELTESFFAQDAERLIVTLRQLRDLGVRIAIDDFGTGYSTLAVLQHLPVDVIKIDRCFVSQVVATPTFIDAIRRIAGSMGMHVTAEGVETTQQDEVLRHLGVDRVQGYLFAHPMPAEQALQWLRAQRQAVELAASARMTLPPSVARGETSSSVPTPTQADRAQDLGQDQTEPAA